MLKLENVEVSYGAVHAIHEASMEVRDGEIVSLIGANGAGKTTILRTITGLKKADSGSITYQDVELLKAEPSKIITFGMAHVPEGRHVFPRMTVEENLQMGGYTKKNQENLQEILKEVYEKFPRLKERRKQLAGDSLRRRAANAGSGKGSDGKSLHNSDGRTFHGTVASFGEGNFSYHKRST